MREDVIVNKAGEYTEKLLGNAPSREGNYLKVKKIL
jgi:Asp-tRNA(Asn)/Glu-tRNA(Gln) amidotransferase C subunit